MPLYGFSGIPIVTTDRIADNAITESKIQNNAISTAKIRDNAITTNKIADNAITTSKIADNAISLSKLSSVISETPVANKIPVANTYGEISYNWFKPAKTVYVDWYYGDDNNPGTNAQPFKTLQRAISSIPPGGFVTIVLKNDYRFDDPSHPTTIHIDNKHVRISLNGYTIYSDIAPNPPDGVLYIKGFHLWHSFLRLHYNQLGSRIVVNNVNDVTPVGYVGFVTLREFSHCEFTVHSLTLDTAVSIELANKTRLAQVFGENSILIRTTSSNATIKFNGPDAKLLAVDTGPCLLGLNKHVSTGVLFKDENGNEIPPTDIASRITGITRDSATGLPPNIVCNRRI